MRCFHNICVLVALCLVSFHSVFALKQEDRSAIQEVINGYADSWNQREGRGFGDGFTADADFVNLFGMYFSGKTEIENRHVQILQTILKGSTLQILDSSLREVQPGLVIALVRWKLLGNGKHFQLNTAGEIREGIFTQVFIKRDDKWLITASQNTLKASPVVKP